MISHIHVVNIHVAKQSFTFTCIAFSKVFHAITEYVSQIFANDLKMLIQTLSVKAQHKIVLKNVCTLWACVTF